MADDWKVDDLTPEQRLSLERGARMRAESDLRVLREKFAALAVGEEFIGESCQNAAHNIVRVLDDEYDPRTEYDAGQLDNVRWRVNN